LKKPRIFIIIEEGNTVLFGRKKEESRDIKGGKKGGAKL